MDEIKELESRLLARTEELLENENYQEVVRMLSSINNELYQIEREAKRLRLMGKLDLDVYRALIDGHFEL